jgi:hypothetical protein
MHCVKCSGTCICQPCRGSGLSGNSGLAPVTRLTRLCPWCKGSKQCDLCGGAEETSKRRFSPYIHVEHSSLIPDSIITAAWTGAPWRFIAIPRWVLLRSEKAQQHWVSWRVRHHYRENGGKLFLFGDIVGYRWVKAPGVSVMIDTRGRFLIARTNDFKLGVGYLSVRDKKLGLTNVETIARAAAR